VTTSTAQNTLHYIWEWAENAGNWAKYLVSLVLRNYDYPDPEEIKQVYNVFLHSIGLLESSPILEIERPTFSSEKKHLQLLTLHSVNGVNRLATGQTLHFAKNVTVIYGENATGKTGYGRILKSLGRCYEKETSILPNVYESEDVEQTAIILLKINDITHECEWRNGYLYADLQNISCFTNECVKISLTPKRELLVTPLGFHLFSILSDELEALSQLHSQYMSSLKTTIEFLPVLNEKSQVYNFLSSLTETTSMEELSVFSVYSEDETELLREKENELQSLNKSLLNTESAILNKQIAELNDLISKAAFHKTTLTPGVNDEIVLRLQEIEKLKENEAKDIQYIAERQGIEFYASPEFTAFLRAAENYLELLNKDYPQHGDICIYCRQPLREEDAIVLLTEYRNLLRDTTQAQLKSLNSQIDALLVPIQQLNEDLSILHSSFGEDANGLSIQPDMLKDYSDKIAALKKVLLSKDVSAITSLDFNLEIDFVISMLTTRIEEVSALKTAKSTVLQELETRELQIKKCIAELKDRLTLHKHENTVKAVINNIKLHSSLSKLSTTFNTNALSRKTTAARSALIEGNFREIFDKELSRFKRSNFEIDVSFETDKGASVISQLIRDKHSLRDILSEGEQKAIALAGFLTELRLEECDAPVVFDDPVTSLDHHIIDQIARRLIELSKERQVILFTHSIIFFNSIKQKSEIATYKGLDFKFYETTKDTNVTGILIESPNIREDNFSHYKGIINTILRTPLEKRERSEVAMAIEGYNNLRAAIEVLVETDLLQSAVKRYRKNIALTSLEKINGNLIDQYKSELSEIFERCCSYTDAHSSTEELIKNPNLEELKIDFDNVNKIRSLFTK